MLQIAGVDVSCVITVILFIILAFAGWGGIGVKQRRWVLERDGFRCQHRKWNGHRWMQCTECQPKMLHAHHILPVRWLRHHMAHVDPHRAENLLTLCIRHHVGAKGVHPEMERALDCYRSGDKLSFHTVMKEHQRLTEGGVIYWDPKDDWQYGKTAKTQTRRFGQKFPEKRRRKPWRKPRKRDGDL